LCFATLVNSRKMYKITEIIIIDRGEK
jgi:hypothetical protein